MRIIIDSQELPVRLRVSRDLLLLFKALGRYFNWGIRYDAVTQTIVINSKSSELPPLPLTQDLTERQSERLKGKTICIDPGHGGSDVGVIGPAGTCEKEHTLAVALLLKQKLDAHGAQVVLTRDSDTSLLNSEEPDIPADWSARLDIVKESESDLFISLHLDAFNDPAAAGTTTFHYGSPASIRLAQCVQSALTKQLGTKDHSARYASFYVIRNTRIPSVLIHMAFISNPEEELLLAGDDGRELAAQGIFEGLMQYYKV